jgi:hypothetical protein
MFKLLALFVLIWIFFKALGMIIRTLFGGGTKGNRKTRYSSSGQTGRKDGINVDHNPNKSNKGYDGGEYVDYEDVD